MIIDILSDLHLDFYFRGLPEEETVKSHLLRIFEKKKGDMLIVAGDIGHNNKQNIHILKHIKSIFGYKYIVCVLGNHDYYLVDLHTRIGYGSNSLLRAEKMRKLINKEESMYCLDGNIIEIEGIKIGGCDSWYDGEYADVHFGKSDEEIRKLWRESINDVNYIHNINWGEYALLEREKIEKIYKDVDIMITHVNPSIKKEHTSKRFREEATTGFFTFDGSNFLENGAMKYWIYGHTHDSMEYEMDGVKCICSAMGYPGETYSKLKHIKVKSKKVS